MFIDGTRPSEVVSGIFVVQIGQRKEDWLPQMHIIAAH